MSEVYDFQAEKLLRRAINDSLPLLENAERRGPQATISGLRTVFLDPRVQWAANRDHVTCVGDKVRSISDLLGSVNAFNFVHAVEIIRRVVSKQGRGAPLVTKGWK